jgi:cytochrome c-type biogenesis protein
MVTYFHTDLIPYFFHTLACPIHWIAPVSAVLLLLYVRVRRENRRYGSSSAVRFFLLLIVVFVLLYLTDVPAIFGRCPGSKAGEVPSLSPGDLPGLLLGISAGLATFLSPCGLPPLPAYISYFLGAKASKERTISLSFLSTSGFVFSLAVFAIAFLLFRNYFGVAISSIGNFVPGRVRSGTYVFIGPGIFDILGYAAGAIAILMGLLIVLRVRMPFMRARSLGKFDRSVKSVFFFSIGWGVASIACSPYAMFPFLLYAITKGGVTPFLGLGLGMAIPVLSVSLLLGAGKGPAVQRMARAAAKIQRYTGLLLILTGIVIVIYTFYYPSATQGYYFG